MTSRRPLAPALLLVLALLAGAAGVPAPAAGQTAGQLAVTRHAGPTRTATAAAIAAATHPDGADHVVLARADGYGDALAAAPLAAALDAPVLLTGPDSLDEAAAAAIDALAPSAVTVLGAIGDPVVAALGGGVEVRRLRGADTWQTYAVIALEVARLTGADRALLVEGQHADPSRGWPDALSASAWAARDRVPVLLTTADALPPATRDALAAIAPSRLIAVGGTAAVSDATAEAARAAAGPAAVLERVAGDGRYDTAVAVAHRAAAGDTPPAVWVASGRNWPDALVAGPAAARSGGVLVLADPASLQHAPATRSLLDGWRGAGPAAHLVGGAAALSEVLADEVATGRIGAPAPEPGGDEEVPRPDVDRPPAVPARNTAPPISAATPWSDPATWPSGRVPQAGEVVTIPADRAVLLDVDPPQLRGLQVDGTLVAADRPMGIDVGWIVVTGHLALGTPEQPLRSQVTVTLHPQQGDAIASSGQGPLAVVGGTLDLHGTTPARPWTRLAQTATAGSTSLLLQRSPGWAVGDKIVIASTSTNPDEAEHRTVTGVEGARVHLDQPLAHTHWGQTDTVGGVAVPMHAEVANLTRNVRITSSAEAIAARQGGHVIAWEGSVARIGGVELTGLGQAGATARYPVHFHMMGSASGSWVRGAAIHHTFNRCLTVHGSSHVDIADTVGVEAPGHCFFMEDGVETGTTFHCNLGLSTRIPREEDQLLESDATPATYWITNPANHWTGNAAAGSEGHGFWFDLPEAPTGLSAGAELDIRRLPLGTFDANVAHSAPDAGWKAAVGIFVEDHHPPTTSVMRANSAWMHGSFGAWVEGAELHGGVLAANGIGFLGQRAALRGTGVVGTTPNPGAADLWRLTGVGFYHQRSEIADVTFAAFGARRHHWQRPGVALEFIAEEQNMVSEVSGARFADATRMRITQPPHPERGPDGRTAAVRDVDGSVSGAPALLTSAHPLMHDASCTWREDLGANACPPGWDRAWLKIADQGGGSLGSATLTRLSDGASAPLDGPRWQPGEASGEVLLDRAYRVGATQASSGHVEVILFGDREGFVDLQIPWPHADAFVYDGWGRWHPVPRGTSAAALASGGYFFDGSTLHVRHTLDAIGEKGGWQRLELCAQAFCGGSGPG